MASIDQDVLDRYDPLLAAIDARLAAIDIILSGLSVGQIVKPDTLTEIYPDGTTVTYKRI